jgi:hypothetical protein
VALTESAFSSGALSFASFAVIADENRNSCRPGQGDCETILGLA